MGSSGVSWRAVKGAVRTAGSAAKRAKIERILCKCLSMLRELPFTAGAYGT